MSRCFRIYNFASAALTAAPAHVATGTTIKTMMQAKSDAANGGGNFTVIDWGYDLDIATPAAAVKCELLTTGTVAATGLTAYNAGDIVKWGDPGDTAAPLSLSTSTSGFTATGEGTITATRLMDMGPPWASSYELQLPLERDTNVAATDYLRIRVTTATSVGMRCWVTIEMK